MHPPDRATPRCTHLSRSATRPSASRYTTMVSPSSRTCKGSAVTSSETATGCQ